MIRVFSILFCLFLFSACGGGPETSKLDYATFTPGRETLRSWSAFSTIERYGCRLPTQLYAIAGPRSVPQEQADFVRASIEQAVDEWVLALEDNPYWRCKDVSVLWGDVGPGSIQIYLDPSVSRAYTIVGQNQIYLPLASMLPSDPYAERIILHEMGHIMGLADTYTEPGYQQPIGQPIGIMNRLSDVSGLTADDRAGAYALYEFINGRGSFCDRGYSIGGAYENKSRVAFCVPSFGANQEPPDASIKADKLIDSSEG